MISDIIVNKAKKKSEIFVRTLIYKDCIYTLFQPIFSLKTGDILGYEVLSRINENLLHENLCKFNNNKSFIEQLFIYAENNGYLWELEKITRKLALKKAKALGLKSRLFINVNPKVIHDESFKEGFTIQRLQTYGLDPSRIVFEITERSSINDMPLLKQSITNYENKDFKIALIDFGACY